MFKPNFSITNNLLTYITKIESAKALIDNSPLVPSWEAKFRDEALTRTVHFGTKIEGNDLTPDQAEQVMRSQTGLNSSEVLAQTGLIARDRDVQEVINYRNVIGWINAQSGVSFKDVFSLQSLKTIHGLTMDRLIESNYSGVLRDKQVVVKSAVDGRVVFRPPIATEIPYLLEDFFGWSMSSSASTTHPIFLSAIAHYQLVYIHPFVEGNGRTARAMSTLMMYALGYDFKRFFSLEQYFDSDVDAYYQALLSVQQTNGQQLTYWMEYFCYGLALEIEKIKSQVTKLSKDLKLKQQLGEQVALSERQIVLLELFSQMGQATSDDAQKVLPNISIDTILRDIKDLIQKGVIEKKGVTKGVSYRIRE
jgi:Fic family protein